MTLLPAPAWPRATPRRLPSAGRASRAEAARDAATATATAARVAFLESGAVHVHAEVASPDRKVAAITYIRQKTVRYVCVYFALCF